MSLTEDKKKTYMAAFKKYDTSGNGIEVGDLIKLLQSDIKWTTDEYSDLDIRLVTLHAQVEYIQISSTPVLRAAAFTPKKKSQYMTLDNTKECLRFQDLWYKYPTASSLSGLFWGGDEDYTGTISGDEFIRILQTEGDLRATYKALDKDGNGTVTGKEFFKYLKADPLYDYFTEEDFTALLQRNDFDWDGKVTFREIRPIIGSILRAKRA